MTKKGEIPVLVPWVYDFILWTMAVVVDLFFREVHPRGSWRIPRRGPILFVAAPHANQVPGRSKYFETRQLTVGSLWTP